MSKHATSSPSSGRAGSDAELTELIRSSSSSAAEALEELYRRHRGPVLAYARSCTRDSHTAEDLASEAFARALRAVRGGRGPEGAWRPYLLTTVRHTAAEWSASARRTQLSSDFEAWASEALSEDGGEEGVLRREEANLALRAFRTLPERWQTALWHSAVEGESPERLAPLLGLSPSGAASLTARAREGLRAAYRVEHTMDPVASEECRYYTGLLAAAVRRAGRPGRAHRSLERHLEHCSRCRHAHTELRDLNRTLSIALPAGILVWLGPRTVCRPRARLQPRSRAASRRPASRMLPLGWARPSKWEASVLSCSLSAWAVTRSSREGEDMPPRRLLRPSP